MLSAVASVWAALTGSAAVEVPADSAESSSVAAPLPGPPLPIGCAVYVAEAGRATWSLPALVALDNGDGTYGADLIMADDTELSSVPQSRLHLASADAVEKWRDIVSECQHLREEGNNLLRSGAVAAAVGRYQLAVARLEALLHAWEATRPPPGALQVGSRVTLGERHGVVACLSAETADLLLDDGDEADDVPLGDLAAELPPEQLEVQFALQPCYLNLARCLLKGEGPGLLPLSCDEAAEEALRLCSAALTMEGPPVTCRYLRAQVLLGLRRAEEAVEDLVEAERLEPANRQVQRSLAAARRAWKAQIRQDHRLMMAMMQHLQTAGPAARPPA